MTQTKYIDPLIGLSGQLNAVTIDMTKRLVERGVPLISALAGLAKQNSMLERCRSAIAEQLADVYRRNLEESFEHPTVCGRKAGSTRALYVEVDWSTPWEQVVEESLPAGATYAARQELLCLRPESALRPHAEGNARTWLILFNMIEKENTTPQSVEEWAKRCNASLDTAHPRECLALRKVLSSDIVSEMSGGAGAMLVITPRMYSLQRVSRDYDAHTPLVAADYDSGAGVCGLKVSHFIVSQAVTRWYHHPLPEATTEHPMYDVWYAFAMREPLDWAGNPV